MACRFQYPYYQEQVTYLSCRLLQRDNLRTREAQEDTEHFTVLNCVQEVGAREGPRQVCLYACGAELLSIISCFSECRIRCGS